MTTAGKSSRRGRPSFARGVHELAEREHLFPAGSKALIMVSGGQDSLALLHLLATGALGEAGPATLHALHVNYHLRGDESDADEALVVRVCGSLGVGLTVLHRPLDKAEGNVQEVAREARRAAALQTAADGGCGRIALGHTADDQVETLLYRMGRYGGLAALAGMRPCDPPWVRPLLECRREDTAVYCRQHGLEFACDRGNSYPGYARTGIRERVLPSWEAELPGAVAAACRTAEVAAEMRDWAAMALGEARAAAAVPARGADGRELEGGLNAAVLLALPAPLRRLLLHDWLAERATPSASRASVLAVESLLEVKGSARRSLGGGWRAVKEYDVVHLEPSSTAAAAMPEPLGLPIPGVIEWGRWTMVAEPVEGFRAVEVASEAIVDADAVTGQLTVRGPVPGDRVRPLGSPGTRKLKEVFSDLRIPLRERPQTPLVVCGGRIVWVGGLVVAEDFKVTRETERFLRLGMAPRAAEVYGCGC